MISVKINGETKEIKNNSSIMDILKKFDIETKIVACALNSDVVKKDKWKNTIIKDGDNIEFLYFVGGGLGI